MDKIYKIRKIGGDKIALLGFFVVSLLMAHMIVVSRSAILLSQPIKLPRSGLSVSMPEGNGWKSDKQWSYYESVFSLRSRFALGTRKPTAGARCVYIPATGTADIQSLFEQKALEANGKIIKEDRITKDTLTFDWIHIENPKESVIFIFGTARLSYNRRLDIEVWQVMNDPGMAESAFKKIVQNLIFEENRLEENPLIETDFKSITQIKSTYINFVVERQISTLLKGPQETFILESTSVNKNITKFSGRPSTSRG